MAKKYNLSSSSDMRRFRRDMERTIMDQARSAVSEMSYDVTCPHCNSTFPAHSGLNICPFCQNQVELKLDINF